MGNNLCIIPARGGSKRLPGKNIKALNGKPLLGYSIEAALDSGVYSKILVSSDDPAILETASKYAVDLHDRSADLAGDNVPVFKVFLDILSKPDIRSEFDTITGMLPTCPFKSEKQVKEAMELLEASDEDASLISVTPFDYPPQFGFVMKESGDLEMTHPEAFQKTTRSQNMATLHHNNGAFWMTRIENYIKHGTFYGGRLIGYEMDAISSFDIDYPYQFTIAEVLAKQIANDEL